MKENYNHKNSHKYNLKCHIALCIIYIIKILHGKFDDNIKTIFNLSHTILFLCRVFNRRSESEFR